MELLLKAVSTVNVDPLKDKAGSYKKDDIIVTMPDGHGWGVGELDTNVFTIVTVSDTANNIDYADMSNEQAQHFSAIHQLPTFRSLTTRISNLKPIGRRKFKYNAVTGEIERKHNAEF